MRAKILGIEIEVHDKDKRPVWYKKYNNGKVKKSG